MAKVPFIVQPHLTAIAIGYRQGNLIADMVAPRTPVFTKDFSWQKYELAEQFTVPETRVGAKGQPNQVDWKSTPVSDSVVDHALDAPVTNESIEQFQRAQAAGLAPNAVDPLIKATRLVRGLVATRREQRVATLMTTLGNYASTNRTTLSGTSQWSDYTNSDPHYAMMMAMDGMIIRPNTLVLGRAVFTVLSLHPKIKSAIYGSVNGNQKAVTREALAALLELDNVHVGEGWLNTAAKGQTPNITRIWGKDAALVSINADADTESGLTFAQTAEFGSPVAGTIEDSDIGMRGGVRVRSGESVKEFVSANDLGYLFKAAAA
ncbi:MAG: hypothetical protein J0M20_01395 [Burkholderiales bacterium]|nr:hypothetical protein [Burkholderiales bacterium]